MEGDGRGGGGGGVASTKEEAAVVDGQLTEDEKMEKFYELIRNYKQARERRRMELERAAEEEGEDGEDERMRKRRRNMKTEDRAASSWIPAFKWEDFRADYQIQFQRSPVIFPTSFNGIHGGDRVDRCDDPAPSEVDGDGLDLRLRL